MLRLIIFIVIVQMTCSSHTKPGRETSKLDVQKFVNMKISEESLQKIKSINDGAIVPRDEISEMLANICASNIDGDYPNPYVSRQVIVCGSEGPIVLYCPEGTAFSPYKDECVWFNSASPYPWRYPWDNNTIPTCDHIAENEWPSSILTLPAEPNLNCGTKLTYCHYYQTVNDGIARPQECPPEHGYSKAANACIKDCEIIDKAFGFWKE